MQPAIPPAWSGEALGLPVTPASRVNSGVEGRLVPLTDQLTSQTKSCML